EPALPSNRTLPLWSISCRSFSSEATWCYSSKAECCGCLRSMRGVGRRAHDATCEARSRHIDVNISELAGSLAIHEFSGLGLYRMRVAGAAGGIVRAPLES